MQKKILIILSFLFFINYVCAYNIVSQNTEITHDRRDIYRISDQLVITDINTTKLELPMVASYDLIIKINNQKYSNISYTTNLLTINLEPNISKINLEIIYLTDYYTSKTNGLWNINYNSRYLEKINKITLTLPKDAQIKDLTNISSARVVNGQMVVTLSDISNVFISYSLISFKKNNYYYLLLLLLIIPIYLLLKKKKKPKKLYKKEDSLLLGLNENEQKIVKLLLDQKDGLTQKQISLKLFLPKGTVSRNITKLVDKGYLEIKKYGVSNKVFLGEVFKKN
jgi:uncharacterized membrane protein